MENKFVYCVIETKVIYNDVISKVKCFDNRDKAIEYIKNEFNANLEKIKLCESKTLYDFESYESLGVYKIIYHSGGSENVKNEIRNKIKLIWELYCSEIY